MSEGVPFHHAQGLTPGCRSLADQLCAAGHVVHLPDLYEGRTFATLSEGAGHAEQVGFGTIVERGRSAAEAVPPDVVYAGLSLGVLPAQMLAQTRPGAAARCCCTRASRSPSSAAGRTASRCRSTSARATNGCWRPTTTSRRRGRSRPR